MSVGAKSAIEKLMYYFRITLCFVAVLYVELYPPFVEVAENENEVFVCVLVTRATGPVVNDLKLRFGTQDLDAIGTKLI